MTSLVLASNSAARAALLTAAGVAFEQAASGVDEAALKTGLLAKSAGPAKIAIALAEAKALAVSARNGGLVIGADQTLDLNGQLMDKAADLDEARVQLRHLRGKSHQLHSAVAVAQAGVVQWSLVRSCALTMRAFSDAFLEDYLSRHAATITACVGGYALEGEGVLLFDRIDGDYFAILGLPLLELLGWLRSRGVLPE